MIAKLKDMMRGRNGEWVISFTTPEDFREEFDDLSKTEVDVTIKKRYRRRSLDANAYCWVLINQIAEKLQQKEPKNGWTPIEVYRNAIRDVAGACTPTCMPSEMFDGYVKDWLSFGIGFQVEELPCKIRGCRSGLFWKGSHMYDSQQMSILINILIQEAEQQGIPTIPEKEAKKMIARW